MALVLHGGTVVTALDPPHVVQADIRIEHGRIAGVGQVPGSGTRRDCTGCLIIPGNVCGHTHLYSALARGMPYRLAPPANFIQILQRIWWRLDRALDESAIRASALLGGMEALLSGTTTVIDHHASPNAIEGSLDIIADALAQLGLRSVLCYEVTDRDGAARAEAGVEENRRFLKAAHPLAGGLVGAHASFTLSKETLDACVDVAREFGRGIHVHVSEDAADEHDAERRFGMRVVRRLAEAGALNAGAILAHCVHVDDAEIAAILDAGATVAHNARSNMNNAVGHTPVERFGNDLILGTDGIGGDMFDESRVAYWRGREDDVYFKMPWPMERLAAGARLVGRMFAEPLLGRIEPGAPADLTVLQYATPTPLSEHTLAGHWLFGLTARHVRDVIVNGELVASDRQLTRVDQDQIAADAKTQSAHLWRRLEGIAPHGFEPAR